MPYLRFQVFLVTLNIHCYYYLITYITVTVIKPLNKIFKLPSKGQLEPAMKSS